MFKVDSAPGREEKHNRQVQPRHDQPSTRPVSLATTTMTQGNSVDRSADVNADAAGCTTAWATVSSTPVNNRFTPLLSADDERSDVERDGSFVTVVSRHSVNRARQQSESTQQRPQQPANDKQQAQTNPRRSSVTIGTNIATNRSADKFRAAKPMRNVRRQISMSIMLVALVNQQI